MGSQEALPGAPLRTVARGAGSTVRKGRATLPFRTVDSSRTSTGAMWSEAVTAGGTLTTPTQPQVTFVGATGRYAAY